MTTTAPQFAFQPESTLTNPNTAPSIKTLTKHMGNVYAIQLRPVGRATVMGQGVDYTTIKLSPNGGCGVADGANYPLLLGFDTQQMTDSFGLGIAGSPYEMLGDTGNNTMTFSLSPGNTTTLGFRAANPRQLPYLSGVTPGAALGVKLYGMYDFIDPKGVTHKAVGKPDPIVSKPELNVLVDNKTIGINTKNELYGLPGAFGGYVPGEAIIFLPGTPPSTAPDATSTGSGTGPGGTPTYTLAYVTSNGTTTTGPASIGVDGTTAVALSIDAIPVSDGNATGQILYRSLDGGTTWGEIASFSGNGAQTFTDTGVPAGAAPSTTATSINVELAQHNGVNDSGLLIDAGDDGNGLAILLNYHPCNTGYSGEASLGSSGRDSFEAVGRGLRIDPDTATQQGGLATNLAMTNGVNTSGLLNTSGDDCNGLLVNIDDSTITLNSQGQLQAGGGTTGYATQVAIVNPQSTVGGGQNIIWDLTTIDNTNGQIWSSANPDRLYAPVDGLYHVRAWLGIGVPLGNTDLLSFHLVVYNAAGRVTYGQGDEQTFQGHSTLSVESIIPLKAGDWVNVLLDWGGSATLPFSTTTISNGVIETGIETGAEMFLLGQSGSGGGSGTSTLAGATDASIISPAFGQILEYSPLGKWQNVNQTHSESVTDGNSNFLFAGGDVVTAYGIPN